MKVELIQDLEIALCKIERATNLLNIVAVTMEEGNCEFSDEVTGSALQAIADYMKINTINVLGVIEDLSKLKKIENT